MKREAPSAQLSGFRTRVRLVEGAVVGLCVVATAPRLRGQPVERALDLADMESTSLQVESGASW